MAVVVEAVAAEDEAEGLEVSVRAGMLLSLPSFSCYSLIPPHIIRRDGMHLVNVDRQVIGVRHRRGWLFS